MAELQPYREYARNARRLLGDARDWLNSDWPEGEGPTEQQARGRHDALVLIGYAKAALDGTFELTEEARRALDEGW